MALSARAMPGQFTSPVPGSKRPGTSATCTSPIDGSDQGQRFLGAGKRDAGMVHRKVEVLEREHDTFFLGHIHDPAERVASLEPHPARDDLDRLNRQAALAEAGTV